MDQALIIFMFSGLVSMSAALSAGTLNKLPEDKRSDWLKVDRNRVTVVLAGNFAALTLIGALAYGFQILHWSIPLSSVFVSFPLVHVLLVQRLIGEGKGLMVTAPLSLVAAVLIYLNWP